MNNICIIDDDPIHIFSTKKLLKIAGYTGDFIVYENGKEAYESLVEKGVNPDLILLDLNMPVMNGWEFLENIIKLVSLETVPPIYIMTSSIDQEEVKKSKKYIIVKDFISKPFTVDKIKSILGAMN